MELASSDLKIKVLERSVSKRTLRYYILIGMAIISLFTIPDKDLIPASLLEPYFLNRFGFQLPVCALCALLTFWHKFDRYRDPILFLLFVAITYANYGFIFVSWAEARFQFPYEGVMLYALFAFFIARIKLSYAALCFVFSTAGFALLVINFPIYGDRTFVHLGFVAATQLLGLVGVYALERSFKAAKHANKTLYKLSRVDPLTGLYNRRAFDEKFLSMLSYAQRHDETISVFMIDIDHFKLYNDTYGHQQGDRVIQMQANILRSVFKREYDCIGRYGGEEFIVATSGIDEAMAKQLAQGILDSWKEKAFEQVFNEEKHYVSCSIGIFATIPSASCNLDYMLDKADKSLYQAKENGRHRAVYVAE